MVCVVINVPRGNPFPMGFLKTTMSGMTSWVSNPRPVNSAGHITQKLPTAVGSNGQKHVASNSKWSCQFRAEMFLARLDPRCRRGVDPKQMENREHRALFYEVSDADRRSYHQREQ